MADQPIQPDVSRTSGGPVNAPQGAGPSRSKQGMGNVADLQNDVDSLSRSAPAVRELKGLLDAVSEILAKTESSTEKLYKRTKEWGSELQQVVTFSEDIEEASKAFTNYQLKMAKEGLKAKSYEEVADVLESMQKQTKKLSEKGLLSKEGGRLVSRQMKELETSLTTIKKKAGEAFDETVVEEMLGKIVKLNRVTLETAKNLKGIRMPAIHKDIAGAEKAVNHLFRRSTSSMEKWQKFAEVGHEIKEARKQRKQGKVEEFRAQRNRIVSRLPSLNINPEKFTRHDGSMDEDALRDARASRRERLRALIQRKASREGMGPLASNVFTRNAMAEAEGAKPGMFTRAGMGLLSRGEGMGVRGPASWGTGMIEGGAGGIAEAAGYAAIPLIALEGLKAAFDKNQKMNLDVSDKLGQGGIYGGSNDAITSLAQVRHNLNPSTPFSRLGIGYDKNLALAQGMVEGGFSVSNLAEGEGMSFHHPGGQNLGNESQHGFVNGSFGTVQRNAYVFGKAAGLSPGETMTQTLKLITQYKQSLGATEDFFVRIARDTRAAGISTSKYLQVIDDVNSQYDRSNKLLMTTVSTMSLLSSTGRDTSEDLKDAMDITTNGGQKRDFGQSAFLNIQGMKDPGFRKQLLGSRQAVYDTYLGNAAQATGHTEAELQAGMADKKTGGYTYLNHLKQEADTNFAHDPVAHQSAISSLKAAEDAYTRLQATKENLGKNAVAGGLGQATSNETLGHDRVSDSMDTLMAVRTALKISHHSVGDYMSDTGRAAINNDPAFLAAMQSVNLNPEKMKGVPQLLEDFTASITKALSNGLTPEEQANHSLPSAQGKIGMYNTVYGMLAKQNLDGFTKNDKDKVGAVQDFASHHTDALYNALVKTPKLFNMMFGDVNALKAFTQTVSKSDKDKSTNDMESLTAATRTTADIYADAFTWLFNMLIDPLKAIERVLTFRLPGSSKSDPRETTADSGDMHRLYSVDTSKAVALAKAELNQMSTNGASPDAINAKKQALADEERGLSDVSAGKKVTRDDVNHMIAFAKGQLEAHSTDAHGSASQIIKDNNLQDLPSTHDALLSTNFKQVHEVALQQMQKAGQMKLNEAGKPVGKAPESYHVTNNTYNSVDFTQQKATTPGVNDANEKPTTPKKVAQ